MYKQYFHFDNTVYNEAIIRIIDLACIPFDPDNSDYQQFKKDLATGASVKTPEGNDMTAEQIATFLGTLK